MLPEATNLEAVLVAARPRLESLARRLVWDDEEARDLVQATCETALVRWQGFRGEGAVEGWLRRILVRQALSWRRRRRLYRSMAVLLFVPVEPVCETDPSSELGRQRHLRALAEGLERLPARQSTAFCLRYLEGLSIDEVADALEIERGTARIHVQRAVKALRARGLLSGEEEES